MPVNSPSAFEVIFRALSKRRHECSSFVGELWGPEKSVSSNPNPLWTYHVLAWLPVSSLSQPPTLHHHRTSSTPPPSRPITNGCCMESLTLFRLQPVRRLPASAGRFGSDPYHRDRVSYRCTQQVVPTVTLTQESRCFWSSIDPHHSRFHDLASAIAT